jgi:hypothetical protein
MPEIETTNTNTYFPNRIIENQDLESLIEKLKENTLNSDGMLKLLTIKNAELETELPNKKDSDTNRQTKDKGNINNIISTLKNNNNNHSKLQDGNNNASNNENKNKQSENTTCNR